MSSEGPVKRRFIRQLITNIKCGVCGRHYELDDVRILSHQGDLWVMGVTCAHCQTQGLVFATVTEAEAPEVIADVTPEEWERFQEMPQINADDVLDTHELLEGFDGDLIELLEGSFSPES